MSDTVKNIAIIGCSGAIGGAFTKHFSESYPTANIMAFSRCRPGDPLSDVVYRTIDYSDESSIEKSALVALGEGPLDMVVVATGILHEDEFMPEKSLRDLSAEKFHRLFEANTIVPALLAKYFLPGLNRENRSVFATLSARVGSVSDNRLGGWYAYRASKAALNMVIKNAAIEIGRHNKQAVVVGLHPGTVDSELSRPFQKTVPRDKIFLPRDSVRKLVEVLESLTPENTGKLFSWDGKEIFP